MLGVLRFVMLVLLVWMAKMSYYEVTLERELESLKSSKQERSMCKLLMNWMALGHLLRAQHSAECLILYNLL